MPHHVRMRLVKRLPQRRERVVGKLLAQHVRQRAQDRPILARVARREGGARRHLHPAFGVHVGRGFFRIGRARQHHVGARARRGRHACRYRRRTRPGAMSISSAPSRKSNIERAGRRHLPRGQAALARHKAEIERADPRGRRVQHAKAVPAVLDRAEIDRRLGRKRRDRRAVRPREGVGADDDQRPLGLAHARRQSCGGRYRRASPAPAPR